MKTNIVSVKYEDKFNPRTFGGKSYTYYTSIKVEIGDLVIAPTVAGDKIARISEVDIPEEKVESIKPYLKTIEHKIDKENYLKFKNPLAKVA